MKIVEEFQVRGLPGNVNKLQFGDRMVDYWAPREPGGHVLVAHDGQNVLDKRNIPINPHQRATWELAQSAIRIADGRGLIPPTVICIYHTPYPRDNFGRIKELSPQRYMDRPKNWILPSFNIQEETLAALVRELNADQLIEDITKVIVPAITESLGQKVDPAKTAILGASMGGLAAIYSVIRKPEYFHTALSFSPHWVIGGDSLAERMISDFPDPGQHKLWMSRGTKGLDAQYEESQDLANRLIREKGYRDGKDLITRTLKRGSHSNATWARYVPGALDFWLKRGV